MQVRGGHKLGDACRRNHFRFFVHPEQKIPPKAGPEMMVRDTGIEPVTPTMSM